MGLTATDRVSILRGFKPDFYAGPKIRIRNDCFYVTRMQNVETDPRCDYVGLAEGEYLEILPGAVARRRRDSRLNHCNDIAKYDGPVLMVRTGTFGHALRQATLVASADEADDVIEAHEQGRRDWLKSCRDYAAQYRAKATPERIRDCALKTRVGIARIDDPAFVEEEIAFLLRHAEDTDAAADKEEANPSWVATVEDVTGRAEYAAQFVN